MRKYDEDQTLDRNACVLQLRSIEAGNPHIFRTIRSYFSALVSRSRWSGGQLQVGDLDRYEASFVEECEILFLQMMDDLDADAAEKANKEAAGAICKWVEAGAYLSHIGVFWGTEFARDAYLSLHEWQRFGLQLEFAERISQAFPVIFHKTRHK